MRAYLVLLILLVTACKTANPDFCCTTEQQCTELGSSELRPCKAGQACDTGTCVAKECDTSADCTDASKPVCINQLCEAKCTGDADCTGSPGGPHCASDGVCVGCVDASQCSSDKPFCDDQTRSCRGCVADGECASGVCNEAAATCVNEGDALYATTFGSDAGQCTKAAPCKTISGAMPKVGGTRRTIHIVGGQLDVQPTTLDKNVVIDGSNTTFIGANNATMFSMAANVTATIEAVTLPASSTPIVTVPTGALLTFANATSAGQFTVTNGSLLIVEATFENAQVMGDGIAVNCMNGTLSATRSHFHLQGPFSIGCANTFVANAFDGGQISVSGGTADIRNNLVTESFELEDAMGVSGVAPGSRVWFNTFVNTSGVASDGQALSCDATVDVSSNIFAYRSKHPHGIPPAGPPCPTKFSLYDEVALPEQRTGPNSVQADWTTFFVNPNGRDFHLSAASPAKGKAQPALDVAEDFDGQPRPRPIGSVPDIGCFEAP